MKPINTLCKKSVACASLLFELKIANPHQQEFSSKILLWFAIKLFQNNRDASNAELQFHTNYVKKVTTV